MGSSNNNLLSPPNLKEYSFTPARAEDLKLEQGVVGLRFPPGQSTTTSAPVAPGKSTGNAVQPPPYLILVWFGKKHFITPPLFERDGYLYDQYHWSEACLMLDSIHGQQKIYEEWVNPDGWVDHLVASSSEATAAVINWFKDIKRAPKPDIKEFQNLYGRTLTVMERISNEKLTAKRVAENGIELALIREDLKRLLTATSKFRENAISGAESAQAVLESVESTSFQILNVAPTILMMDPFREAGYKITMALVNATARGAGGAIAKGTIDGFVQEAWSKLKKDIPGLVADVVLIPIGPLAKKLGWKAPTQEAVTFTVQLCVEFTAGLWGVAWQAKDHKINRSDVERQCVQALSTMFGKGMERLFHVKVNTSNTKLAIAACAESLAKVLTTDLYQAIRIAEERDSNLSTVLIQEAPSTIMKLVEAVLVGIIQRKGRQYADLMENERVSKPRNYDEASEIAVGVSVSDVWNTKPSRAAFRDIRSKRGRVGIFTKKEYDSGPWRNSNLEYYTAAQLRRYSDECNMWCFFRAPNASRLNHTADRTKKGAKWGKPMTIHAKSANHPGLSPDVGGLVMKPSNGDKRPATHKNYDSAQAQWSKYLHELKNAGHMIRPDGVVFHPDQLISWGKMNGWESDKYKKTVDVLIEMQKRGIYDFTPDADQEQLQLRAKFHEEKHISPEEWDRVESTMRTALVGFYSDLDPIDFVDAKNGKSVHFGNKDNEGMDLAAQNRRLINDYISRDLDGETIDQKPRDSGAPGVGGSGKPTRDEHPESEIQHGGSEQMFGRAVQLEKDAKQIVYLENGCFAVGPDGKIVIFNHRIDQDSLRAMSDQEQMRAIHEDLVKQWNELLRQEVGPAVKGQGERMNEMTKDYRPISIKVKKVKQKAPKLSVKEVEEVNAIQAPTALVDIDGLGYEITLDTVALGLMKRDLRVSGWKIRDTIRNDWGDQFGPARGDVEAMLAAFETNRCRLGIDAWGSNIVIACAHFRQSMADVLVQLLKCRRLLGNIPSTVNNRPLQVWYEIHSAYSPVNTRFISNRIGQPATGVNPDKQSAEFGDQCESLKKHEKKTHFAFGARGRTAAYTPSVLLKRHENYFGLRLVDIWEDRKTLELDWDCTKIRDAGPAGSEFCEIAVFTSPLWTNAEADRRYIESEDKPVGAGRH